MDIKIERVLYWAMGYFKVIRATAREIKKRQNDIWWGKDGEFQSSKKSH